MEWNKLLSLKRYGDQSKRIRKEQDETRLGFEVDYDRIVFSASFRSLQDKTQVIPFSKTDQTGEGRMIFLPVTNDNYCPVKALNRWLEIAMIEKGPLFYKINKSNTIEKYTMNFKNQKVSLNDSSFVLILKKRASAAGLDNCNKISGHSLRIGSITQARMNGVPTYEIMAQSGHKTTQMIDRYTKLSNIKETSAAKKI